MLVSLINRGKYHTCELITKGSGEGGGDYPRVPCLPEKNRLPVWGLTRGGGWGGVMPHETYLDKLFLGADPGGGGGGGVRGAYLPKMPEPTHPASPLGDGWALLKTSLERTKQVSPHSGDKSPTDFWSRLSWRPHNTLWWNPSRIYSCGGSTQPMLWNCLGMRTPYNPLCYLIRCRLNAIPAPNLQLAVCWNAIFILRK